MKGKKSVSLLILVIFLMVFAYFMDSFIVLQNMIYDGFYLSDGEINDDIIIVGIDDVSYANIGRWPYSREIQSEIFRNILKDEPAVLGIDIIYDSYTSYEDDELLLNTLKDNPVVLASVLITGKEKWGNLNENTLLSPFKELNQVVDIGYINPHIENQDYGVVRKATLHKLFNNENYSSFAYEIYKKYLIHNSLNDELATTNYNTRKPLYINYSGPPDSYKMMSAYHVYSGLLPEGFFNDKIVLFGPYSLGMQDNYTTPTNNIESMYGIEIHANIIQTLIDNKFRTDTKFYFELILIIFSGLIAFFVSRKMKPLFSLLINTGLIIAILILGKLMFNNYKVLHIIYPILTIAILFFITIVYNYIEQLVEKRRITNIFGKYVAPQIVSKILEEGEESLKLGGTRKYISVLFVDIRGFTPLSEKAQPEEVVEILNEYLDLCAKSIFNNGGTLDKFIGDATMAIYNAPLELENHAYYAVKTAWDMKQGAEPLMERLKEKYDRVVQFGIGVNTGYAVVGNIGSKDRMDYTAIGDTVNTSARLESNAKAGQIIISKETYELVKDKVLVTPLGGLKVKGKTEELEVYQVDGLKL